MEIKMTDTDLFSKKSENDENLTRLLKYIGRHQTDESDCIAGRALLETLTDPYWDFIQDLIRLINFEPILCDIAVEILGEDGEDCKTYDDLFEAFEVLEHNARIEALPSRVERALAAAKAGMAAIEKESRTGAS